MIAVIKCSLPVGPNDLNPSPHLCNINGPAALLAPGAGWGPNINAPATLLAPGAGWGPSINAPVTLLPPAPVTLLAPGAGWGPPPARPRRGPR